VRGRRKQKNKKSDDKQNNGRGRRGKQKPTDSSSSSKFSTRVAVATGLASPTTIEDIGGFAKWILHFCTAAALMPAGLVAGRAASSYCTERPSLIPMLALRTGRSPGLLITSELRGLSAGDAWGNVGDADPRAVSAKDVPRWVVLGSASRERELGLTGTAGARGDGGLGARALVETGRAPCGRMTRPNVSCTVVTSVLGSEMSVRTGEVCTGEVCSMAGRGGCGRARTRRSGWGRAVLVVLGGPGGTAFCGSVPTSFSSNCKEVGHVHTEFWRKGNDKLDVQRSHQ